LHAPSLEALAAPLASAMRLLAEVDHPPHWITLTQHLLAYDTPQGDEVRLAWSRDFLTTAPAP
jgi:hypothetical protein